MTDSQRKAREVAEEIYTVCGIITSNPEFERIIAAALEAAFAEGQAHERTRHRPNLKEPVERYVYNCQDHKTYEHECAECREITRDFQPDFCILCHTDLQKVREDVKAARAEALEEAAKVPLNPEIVGRTEMARAIRAISSEAPAAREGESRD